MKKKKSNQSNAKEKNKKSLNARRWLVEPGAGGHTIGDLHSCTRRRLDPFIRIAQVRADVFTCDFIWWGIDIRRVPSERWRLLLIPYIHILYEWCVQHDAHSIPFFCSVGFLDLVVPPPPPPSLPPPPMLLQSLYWKANEIQSNNIIIQASSCTTRCAVQQEKTY